MLTATELQAVRAFLDECIEDVDSEIIHGLREAGRVWSKAASRESLLSQLDVLERVRERLNVRVDYYIERNIRAG